MIPLELSYEQFLELMGLSELANYQRPIVVLAIFFLIIGGTVFCAWLFNRYMFTSSKRRKPLLKPVLTPVRREKREWGLALRELRKNLKKLFLS